MSVPEKKYLLGNTDREYTEAERSVLAALRQHQISLRGRPKKTRDELMVELEASPVFLSFCKVVEDTPKLRPSVIAKLLKSADALISKEYKAALLESMQRRARRKEDVIEAVRQEAVRKMSQDEDIHFEDENSGGFTKEELRQRLDDAQRSRTAHAAYADASELVGGWTIPETMPPLPPGVKGPPPAPPPKGRGALHRRGTGQGAQDAREARTGSSSARRARRLQRGRIQSKWAARRWGATLRQC